MQVLPADSLLPIEHTDHILAEWMRKKLPIPSSWQVTIDALADDTALKTCLEGFAAEMPERHYWVLHQGQMNEKSLRQSLVNLDTETALVSALAAHFKQSDQNVIIQLLPGWQAAGILFTRHPLRQDLDHIVVEGVTGETQPVQRLIYRADAQLVFRSQDENPLDTVVPARGLQALTTNLKDHFEAPQAAEWVYDGETLWLLQTLPIGSLPVPQEAWTCRVEDNLWYQAVTPLWYTLESRWLKNRFWEPRTRQLHKSMLDKVEPYRRQHSHLYRNSLFFHDLPDFEQALPPAWRQVPKAHQLARQTTSASPGWLTRQRFHWRLQRLERHAKRLQKRPAHNEWQRLMELDWMGEMLSWVTGGLHYSFPARRREEVVASLPTSIVNWLTRGNADTLRVGMDPVFPALEENPPEMASLGKSPSLKLPDSSSVTAKLRQRATALREELTLSLRKCLTRLGEELVSAKLLDRSEDIFFCYFDELWQLQHNRQIPGSIQSGTLLQRKKRYLTDAHAGAPDWKLDQFGFGFNQDKLPHELLMAKSAVAGQAKGPVRRLVSGWVLNQVKTGDILVIHQCDPHWLPWLVQAAGLIVSSSNENDAAVLLAKWLDIPCVYALDDAMHCLVDDQQVELDATAGEVNTVQQ